ncbi:protein kinase domain-containing protein [Aliterella atlantica]|uniref:protein kinase domain-containing protein n=1 Tax=Aliterella atlantica TaxID=1827278 RepID=UPI0006969099|nr:protein kinase [Aliterella atlantica]
MQNEDVLRGRYKIIRNLGRGGFGETYLAEDLDRPSHPKCVVKKLHATFNSVKELEIAKRFFNTEAQALYNLGDRHSQIPRLLAHFEEDSNFYLVQDCVDGQDLSKEFAAGRCWNESQVTSFLKDILGILAFVHQQKVIHRDIKPANIIRRKQDGKMVLIDFGAVKEIQTIVNTQGNTHLTVGIGTQGYMPPEQRLGKPRLSSDIYAVGMTAIQALTGTPPERLPENEETDEVVWREQAKVSDRLAAIIDKMVKPQYRDRYQSAIEVLEDIYALANPPQAQTAPQSKSKQANGGSTVISKQTKQQSVTTRQQSVVSNTAPDEPKPKHSFGFAIALSIMGAVAATLGVSQLVDYLQSKPASQPVAQAPTQPSPETIASPELVETPVASPYSPTTPESSPSAITSATPEISPVSLAQGQSIVSITEMNCLTTNAAPNYQSFQKLSQNTTKGLTIGQEVVTPVATLSSFNFESQLGSDIAILVSTPAGVACNLEPPESGSQYRRLTLAVGVSNTSLYIGQASKIRLTAYANQKNIGSKEVIRGGKQFWNIDVTNVQNIALQAECIKGDAYTSRSVGTGTYGQQFELCPALVFTQADLK